MRANRPCSMAKRDTECRKAFHYIARLSRGQGAIRCNPECPNGSTLELDTPAMPEAPCESPPVPESTPESVLRPACGPAQGAAIGAAVLDTNVALDWLVFGDAAVAPLQQAVSRGAIVWLSCPAMRGELAHMLTHPSLSSWGHDPVVALAAYDQWVLMRPDPGPPGPANPRCSDPDDQVFIDLAIACGARWLLTHDKALLKLARRLRPWRIEVSAPRRWTPASDDE